GLDVNLASLLVDQVMRRKAAEDFLGWDDEVFEPILASLVGTARGDLLACLEDDFARVGVDHVVARLHAPPRFDHIRDLPAVLAALIDDGAVEGVEDVLARKPKRMEEGGDRKLALA